MQGSFSSGTGSGTRNHVSLGDYSEAVEAALDYIRRSAPHINCKFHPMVGTHLVAMVATRDVSAGEELLASYSSDSSILGHLRSRCLHGQGSL